MEYISFEPVRKKVREATTMTITTPDDDGSDKRSVPDYVVRGNYHSLYRYFRYLVVKSAYEYVRACACVCVSTEITTAKVKNQ